jgi:prepilin-type N-terminal cleavage/methylation domain-containing protein
MRCRQQGKWKGFTLIELILVVAIMAVTVGLLVPVVLKVRELEAQKKCHDNLRQLGIAMHQCNDTHKMLPHIVDSFPPGTSMANKQPVRGTWLFYLLPFLHQESLYRKTLANSDPWGAAFQPMQDFLCPSDPSATGDGVTEWGFAASNYAANFLVFRGKGEERAAIPRTFTDGTSQTIVFAERYANCNGTRCGWNDMGALCFRPQFAYFNTNSFQVAPTLAECDSTQANSPHGKGMFVGLGDASVRFIASDLERKLYAAALTPAGGEADPRDWCCE